MLVSLAGFCADLDAQSPATPLPPVAGAQPVEGSGAQMPTFGKVTVGSLEEFDAQLDRLSAASWGMHAWSYPGGKDSRGRTLEQDVDDYLLTAASEARLKALRSAAGDAKARGDTTALRRSLQEAQLLVQSEDYRASVLGTYAATLHALDAHRSVWAPYADRVSPEKRAASQQHIDKATGEYAAAVERALRSGVVVPTMEADQTQALGGSLVGVYNKERGDLAAELTEQDRALGRLPLAYVRQRPCPPPASRTSGAAHIWVDSMLKSPADYYPIASRRMGFEGLVKVRLWISETGCLERAEIKTSSGIPELDQAAMKFVEEGITFLPAEIGGKPVADSNDNLPVRFKLQ